MSAPDDQNSARVLTQAKSRVFIGSGYPLAFNGHSLITANEDGVDEATEITDMITGMRFT